MRRKMTQSALRSLQNPKHKNEVMMKVRVIQKKLNLAQINNHRMIHFISDIRRVLVVSHVIS